MLRRDVGTCRHVAQPQGDSTHPPDLLLIDRIRAEFYQCCRHGATGSVPGPDEKTEACAHTITPRLFARYWMELVQSQRGRKQLDPAELDLIALRVAQLMHEMDFTRRGHVRLEDWVHFMLLKRAGLAGEQVNSLVSKALHEDAHVLRSVQNVFEHLAVADDGVCTLQESLDLHSFRPLTPRCTGQVGVPSPTADPAAKRTEDAAKSIGVRADEHDCYPAVVVRCLRQESREVVLHLYDISAGLADAASPWIVGQKLEGLWHTGAVVFGSEYYYTRDIMRDIPGETAFGKPKRVVHLGYTSWHQDEVHEFIIRELKPRFHRDTYDVVTNNCNHFTDLLTMHLAGRHVPKEIMQQPMWLLQSRFIQIARPLLNWYLRDRIVAFTPGEKLPSGMPRVSPADRLKAGTLVCIHPQHAGESRMILGRVASRDEELRRKSPDEKAPAPGICCGVAGAAETRTVCVHFLDDGAGIAHARLRTEPLPCGRLCVAELANVASESAYALAMSALCKGADMFHVPGQSLDALRLRQQLSV